MRRQDLSIAGPQTGPPTFLYARVSSKEQESEGFSIPAQVKFLRDYAGRHGLTIAREFEEAFSAREAGRPAFGTLLSELRKLMKAPGAGPKAAILVEKMDRLTRNMKDMVILDDLVKQGLAIHLAKDGVVWDKDSKSQDTFMLGIRALMARNYSENLSEEVRKGQREKASHGLWPSVAPIGYANNREKRTIEPHPHEGLLVADLFRDAATGRYTLKALGRLAFENGLLSRRAGKQIPKCAIARILTNPIYYGTFRWKGKVIAGSHEPLISLDLFNQVQLALKVKSKPHLNRRHHLFTGFMTCSFCGCSLTGQLQKGHVYYACTQGRGPCPQSAYLREEYLVGEFAAALGKLRMDDEAVEWVRQKLVGGHATQAAVQEAAYAQLQGRHTRIRGFMERAYTDRLEGLISTDDFVARKAGWEKDLAAIEAKLRAIRRTDAQTMVEGARILDVVRRAQDIFLKAERFEKRRILELVLSNPKAEGKKIVFTWKSPFHLMAEGASLLKWRSLRDLNARPPA